MDTTSRVKLRTGREMPIIGLGTWKLDTDSADVVAHAIHSGYRMIDTSGDYGTQPVVGEGIKKSGVAREDIYLVTKVEETDEAYEAARKNLYELQEDYADLMLIHRPPKIGVGEQLWKDLIRAKNEGFVTDIGVSNYSIEQIKELIDLSGEVPVVNQIEWSPFGHDPEMLEFCKRNHIVVQAYSPITRGHKLEDERLVEIAGHYDKTPAQVLIRWNLQLGTVPLPKSNHLSHQQENINVFDFEITEEDMGVLSSMNEHYSALGKTLQYI